jgi:sec-independent protein translocase protein TatC
MTTTAPPPPKEQTDSTEHSRGYDPDSYRMTIGEHLEELRTRLILSLAGFVIAAFVCLGFGQKIVEFFCKPLTDGLMKKNLNPQLFFTEISEGFMVYMKISLVCAAAVAGPWMLYQIWKFIAAGLYPHERKYVTKYIPLSIILLIAGMCFVYFIVLPWTITFFIGFGDSIPLPGVGGGHVATTLPASGLPTAPMLDGDPANPVAGQFWINRAEGRLKLYFGQGDLRVIPFGPSGLLAPHIVLSDYIDLVVGSLLTFGLCFQLPLVVLALVRVGIVEIDTFRKSRRYVYFTISLIAAAITPGDLVTAMLALMAPLILLFELGIWLAKWNTPKETPVS